MVPKMSVDQQREASLKLYEIIASGQSGQAIANLATASNVEPGRLDAAIRAMLPEFAHGLERNTLSRGGLADPNLAQMNTDYSAGSVSGKFRVLRWMPGCPLCPARMRHCEKAMTSLPSQSMA